METDSLFSELYDELLPVIYRFVSVRIPKNDIEDVVAEILAKVWQSYSTYQGNSSVKTWALRITYNHIADYYRALKRIPSVLPLENAHTSSEDHSEQWLTLLSIGQALSCLTASQVSAIQLRLMEGYSSDEVAHILGISQQAVDSLLYRAKKSFRRYYLETTGGGQHA